MLKGIGNLCELLENKAKGEEAKGKEEFSQRPAEAGDTSDKFKKLIMQSEEVRGVITCAIVTLENTGAILEAGKTVQNVVDALYAAAKIADVLSKDIANVECEFIKSEAAKHNEEA